MLTVRQVAERLAVSPDSVRGLIAARRLRAINVSPSLIKPRYRIDEAAVEEFVRGSSVSGETPSAQHRRRTPDHEAMAFMRLAMQRKTQRSVR